MLQSIYGDLAEKFALNYCLSSDDFVSAQDTPFPEEEFGNVHLVHSPCHTHAAAKSEDGSSDKEQYPRRVEGKYG